VTLDSISFEFHDDCVSDLDESLEQGPLVLVNGRETRILNEQTVDHIGGLTVEIRADEHPPPHFHVTYGGEENSFRIDDGAPMHPQNGLKKYFRNINNWYKSNRQKLVDAWNNTRPSDCPVGSIR